MKEWEGVTQSGKVNASPIATPDYLLTLHLAGRQEVAFEIKCWN